MSIDTLTPPAEATAAPPTGVSPERLPLPPELMPFAAEAEAYYRELPRLLDAGESGRFAVVHGGRVHGTWDTYRDAKQFGRERFADELFMAQRIDRRFLAALAPYFGESSTAEGD
jgi:hypothetical protein